MPHASGIIYIDTSTTPHKGVSIVDIQQTLGTGAYSTIGGLIVNGNINKWAKYKPVRLTVLGTDDQLEEDAVNHRMVWKSTADWWKGSDGLCGLSIPSYPSGADLDGETVMWQYLRPRGLNGSGQGAHEWYRFKDFVEYNHNAIVPLGIDFPQYVIRRGGNMETAPRVRFLLPATLLDDSNLAISDFDAIQNCYWGVAAFQDRSLPYFKTADTKVSAGSATIDISDCPLFSAVGTVRLYAFLSTRQQTTAVNQFEYPVYYLNPDNGIGHAETEVKIRPDDTYACIVSGLTTSDLHKLSLGTPYTNSEYIYMLGTVTGSSLTNNYTLTGVTARAIAHMSQTVADTRTIAAADCYPSSITNDMVVGTQVTFRAPIPGWQLPILTNPDDYYEYKFTFEFELDL